MSYCKYFQTENVLNTLFINYIFFIGNKVQVIITRIITFNNLRTSRTIKLHQNISGKQKLTV